MRVSRHFCKDNIIILFLVMLFSHPLLAAFERHGQSARFHALAGAGCASTQDPSLMSINPASTFGPHAIYIQTSYANLFNAGIHSSLLQGTLKINKHMVNIALSALGNDLYQEHMLGVGLCKAIHSSLNIGINSRVGRLAIKNYGQQTTAMLDVGLQAALFKNIHIGTAAHNILGAKIGREYLPQSMQGGVYGQLSSNITLYLDIYKDIDFQSDIRCGTEYQPFQSLTLRFGTGTQPSRIAAGFDIQWSRWHIEYGFNSHVALGFTHQFAFSYHL